LYEIDDESDDDEDAEILDEDDDQRDNAKSYNRVNLKPGSAALKNKLGS
jgi:hypothetical protein